LKNKPQFNITIMPDNW